MNSSSTPFSYASCVPKKVEDPNALKREAAGRYATPDGRFSVEQEAGGGWVLVDAEQTNELGLPLVRGPFATLAAARAAVPEARRAPAPESPLAERMLAAERGEARRDEETGTGPKVSRGRSHPAVEGTARPADVPRLDARPARPDDASAIARIYNVGIESREATFETEPRSRGDVLGWFDGRHPIVVVTRGDEIVAFAATFEYRARAAYSGVAEFSVYADPERRRQGAGRMAMQRLIDDAAGAGFWKLVSRVFPDNEPSRALLRGVGFREVGTYRRHARLDGEWRDAVIVERLLGEAAET
jgi:phosphinothricin acetyltransferase